MLKSLYSILNPLLEQGKEGWLKLSHEHGKTAVIAIKQGQPVSIQMEPLHGAQALKELALWLFFTHDFSEESIGPANPSLGVEIEKYLQYLKKVDEKTLEIQTAIPPTNHTYKISADNFIGSQSFKPDELKVALAMDGKTTIKSIIKKTGITDLLALAYIAKLNNLGLAKKVELMDCVLAGEQAAKFMESLTEKVTDYLGPAADLVLDEAFEGFESSPQKIYKNELPDLTVAIASQLDDSDRVIFKKWSLEMIKKL
ncbi:MAG: hypothetical protein QNJ17_11405 [Desulfocapsaceae bacterium]|nr:hypothetical protein [Desulfocapsaceae bacterium]